MSSLIASIAATHLQWFPEIQIGWYPVTDQPYDAAYWAKYLKMDDTAVGAALTRARVQLMAPYYSGGDVVDVGIGGGRFVRERLAMGFDINPQAVAWLKSQDVFLDPYVEKVEAATFWDSLEHIHDPLPLLANVRRWVFVSCPIFEGPEHVLRSRHYRKDEHCWYFTARGLEGFMAGAGFVLRETNPVESQWREDIRSFVFERAEG